MREILFRGKWKNNGKWVEGFPVQTEEGNFYIANTAEELGCGICIQELEEYGNYEVIPETVGQYTGLTDKNGKKIFEGDMCRVTRPCVLAYGQITFRNGCFWFVDDSEGGMLRLCDVKIDGFQIEVIGNIHDNPEKVTERRGQSDIL